MKFRKKPVVIEAWEIRYVSPDQTECVPSWLLKAICDGVVTAREDCSLDIKTLEGTHHGSLGDMLIKGVKGEFYPCKPDIFAATYEPAE